jgi:hypothetical protein
MTALMHAVDVGHYASVVTLLTANAAVNLVDNVSDTEQI